MSTSLDGRILRFENDLQLEARTVLSHSAEPQNAFEVAVILETLGYTDDAARELGCKDVFELGRRVYLVIGDFGDFVRAQLPLDRRAKTIKQDLRYLCQGLLYSAPWMAATALLLATGAAFWSSAVNTPALAAGFTLALFVALVSTGFFLQAFARRGTFYLLQGKMCLVRWTALVWLGTGAFACIGLFVGLYFWLERAIAAYTPGTTRSFLAEGILISLLLLSFAPLYVMKAFGWLLAALAVGAIILSGGLAAVPTGLFVDPFSVIKVQLISLASMLVVAIIGGCYLMWDRYPGSSSKVPSNDKPPRLLPVVRSVMLYAVYGSAYFLLIIVDQLVAGGAWSARFAFNQAYEAMVGVSLLTLLPVVAYVVASSEEFPHAVMSTLFPNTVADVDDFRHRNAAFYRQRLRNVVLVGLVSATTVGLAVVLLGRTTPFTSILVSHRPAMLVTLVSYVCLAVGVLNTQLLFALSRPAVPAFAALGGSLLSFVVGGLISSGETGRFGAVVGLLCGTILFAAATTWRAWQSFHDFDATYYGAF